MNGESKCFILKNDKMNKSNFGFLSRIGAGFMRFNYACPRAYVEEQMERLNRAFAAEHLSI